MTLWYNDKCRGYTLNLDLNSGTNMQIIIRYAAYPTYPKPNTV